MGIMNAQHKFSLEKPLCWLDHRHFILLASIPAFLIQVIVGVVEGHSAVLIPQILDSSNLAMSPSDTSFVASLGLLLAPFFAVMGKPLMNTFGRKFNLYLFYVLSVFGFLSVAVATENDHVAFGRLMSSAAYGLGGCSFIYIKEISTIDQREGLLFVLEIMRPFGLFLVYFLGGILPWNIATMVFVITSHLGLLYVFHIPQSPTWSVNQGRLDEAEKSLKWLRSDHSELDKEIAAVKISTRDVEFQSKQGFASILTPELLKPFVLVVLFSFFQHLTGIYVILFYASYFFSSLNTNFSALGLMIGLTFLRIWTTMLWKHISSRTSEKTVVSVACLGMCFCITGVSICLKVHDFSLVEDNFLQWITIFFCSLYILIGSGIDVLRLPINFKCIFPASILHEVCGFTKFLNYFLYWMCVKLYPSYVDSLGLATVLFYFSAVGAFICYIFLQIVFPKYEKESAPELEEVESPTKLQLSTHL